MTREKDCIVESFSELAPRYEAVVDTELNRFWGWRYTDFADHLLAMTPIQSEDRVLDVATGTAVIPRKIANQNHRTNAIHGLDITPAMLRRAQVAIHKEHPPERFNLVCASAMEMPYRDGFFDVVLCGLATHHMKVDKLLAEMYRVLDEGGQLTISDVGASPRWGVPGAKFLLKIFAFVYISLKENPTRAWAEADAVNNIRTLEEWYASLVALGFENIRITRLHSKYFWIPKPMLIRATKNHSGG
jgi:ubiquinone/menaquinone biosynthesis C-methylase UbiE